MYSPPQYLLRHTINCTGYSFVDDHPGGKPPATVLQYFPWASQSPEAEEPHIPSMSRHHPALAPHRTAPQTFDDLTQQTQENQTKQKPMIH